MAGSVNRVTLLGRVGRDPEVRTFGNGGRVVSFSMVTSEVWRDKSSGERKERAEWHSIQIMNENLGKTAEQYLRKGSNVYIEGQIQTREYEKDGTKHKITEIVIPRFGGHLTLLDSRSEDQARPAASGGGGGSYQKLPASTHDLNDEVPF